MCFLALQMMKVRCETEQEYFLQHMVHQKMHGFNMPHPKCKGTILIELATELRHLKEELVSPPLGKFPLTSSIHITHFLLSYIPPTTFNITFRRRRRCTLGHKEI